MHNIVCAVLLGTLLLLGGASAGLTSGTSGGVAVGSTFQVTALPVPRAADMTWDIYAGNAPYMEWTIAALGAFILIATPFLWWARDRTRLNFRRMMVPTLAQAFLLFLWAEVLELLRQGVYGSWDNGSNWATALPWAASAAFLFAADIFFASYRLGPQAGFMFLESPRRAEGTNVSLPKSGYSPFNFRDLAAHAGDFVVPYALATPVFLIFGACVVALITDWSYNTFIFLLFATIAAVITTVGVIVQWVLNRPDLRSDSRWQDVINGGYNTVPVDIKLIQKWNIEYHLTQVRVLLTMLVVDVMVCILWTTYRQTWTLNYQSNVIQWILFIYLLFTTIWDWGLHDIAHKDLAYTYTDINNVEQRASMPLLGAQRTVGAPTGPTAAADMFNNIARGFLESTKTKNT